VRRQRRFGVLSVLLAVLVLVAVAVAHADRQPPPRGPALVAVG
jgi:hypothetical protein